MTYDMQFVLYSIRCVYTSICRGSRDALATLLEVDTHKELAASYFDSVSGWPKTRF